MRLYLKLALMIAVAVLIHPSVRPAGRCAGEVRFAARCWLADQLQDPKMRAQLVDELQSPLVEILEVPPLPDCVKSTDGRLSSGNPSEFVRRIAR